VVVGELVCSMEQNAAQDVSWRKTKSQWAKEYGQQDHCEIFIMLILTVVSWDESVHASAISSSDQCFTHHLLSGNIFTKQFAFYWKSI